MSTQIIRQMMRRRRAAMGVGAQMRAAHRLKCLLLATPQYRDSQHIAVYCAAGGEIDLRGFIKQAWLQGKSCYLPVIRNQHLVFVHYTPATPLVKNRFGIAEPSTGAVIHPKALDLVLTPLVAFDKRGHRIGMGGGYYDRTFAFSGVQQQVYLMGVAHRCQQVQAIIPESWDVALDQVVFA